MKIARRVEFHGKIDDFKKIKWQKCSLEVAQPRRTCEKCSTSGSHGHGLRTRHVTARVISA